LVRSDRAWAAAAVFDAGSAVRLTRYSFVPGVRISGTLRAGNNGISGRVTVEGTRTNANGFVQLAQNGGATGRLGGRPFTYRGPTASASAAGAVAADGLRTGALPSAALLRRVLHPTARRIVP